MKAKIHVKLENGEALDVISHFTAETLFGLDLQFIRPNAIKEIIVKPMQDDETE